MTRQFHIYLEQWILVSLTTTKKRYRIVHKSGSYYSSLIRKNIFVMPGGQFIPELGQLTDPITSGIIFSVSSDSDKDDESIKKPYLHPNQVFTVIKDADRILLKYLGSHNVYNLIMNVTLICSSVYAKIYVKKVGGTTAILIEGASNTGKTEMIRLSNFLYGINTSNCLVTLNDGTMGGVKNIRDQNPFIRFVLDDSDHDGLKSEMKNKDNLVFNLFTNAKDVTVKHSMRGGNCGFFVQLVNSNIINWNDSAYYSRTELFFMNKLPDNKSTEAMAAYEYIGNELKDRFVYALKQVPTNDNIFNLCKILVLDFLKTITSSELGLNDVWKGRQINFKALFLYHCLLINKALFSIDPRIIFYGFQNTTLYQYKLLFEVLKKKYQIGKSHVSNSKSIERSGKLNDINLKNSMVVNKDNVFNISNIVKAYMLFMEVILIVEDACLLDDKAKNLIPGFNSSLSLKNNIKHPNDLTNYYHICQYVGHKSPQLRFRMDPSAFRIIKKLIDYVDKVKDYNDYLFEKYKEGYGIMKILEFKRINKIVYNFQWPTANGPKLGYKKCKIHGKQMKQICFCLSTVYQVGEWYSKRLEAISSYFAKNYNIVLGK